MKKIDLGGKKSLLVIVPGYELVQSGYQKCFVGFASRFLGVDDNDAWSKEFAEYVKSHLNYDAEVFKWNPGLTRRFSLQPAANDLADLLRSKSTYERVVIFSKSLGGIVSELALRRLNEKEVPNRLIYVATPQKYAIPNIPRGIEVFNVFSKDDTLARWGNFLLHFSRVYELEGRINLELSGLTHADFNHNQEILNGGRKIKLYDLYLQLICQ